MRKLQNIISNFGNIIARQGNMLVVRIEASRSLRAQSLKASASKASASKALSSLVSELASWLRNDAWQGLYLTRTPSPLDGLPVGTVNCFVTTSVVVKQSQRRHQMQHCIIGRHRTAA